MTISKKTSAAPTVQLYSTTNTWPSCTGRTACPSTATTVPADVALPRRISVCVHAPAPVPPWT